MEFTKVYKCLSDGQRVRIVNLLQEGPLCVCHLMEILGADQVKVSKQLRYMKELGMVEAERVAQWMVYRLADGENPLLRKNLQCLKEDCAEAVSFAEDNRKRERIRNRISREAPACAGAMEALSR